MGRHRPNKNYKNLLRRPCIQCGKMYYKTGRFSKYCEHCSNNNRLKAKKRAMYISALRLFRDDKIKKLLRNNINKKI